MNFDRDSFEVLKVALMAYNESNKQSNRLWLASSIFSLGVLSFTFDLRIGEAIGLAELDSDVAVLILVILTSITNVSYCVAHANAYRISRVYHSIKDEYFTSEMITSQYSWQTFIARIPASNFNRIYPLFSWLDRKINRRIYRIFKILYDAVFCGFPALAIGIGILESDRCQGLYGFSLVFGCISVSFTILLLREFLFPEKGTIM